MRTYAVFFVLVAMLIGFGFVLVSTPHDAYKAPREELTAEGDAGAPEAGAPVASVPKTAEAGAAPVGPSTKLRVAVLSWELAAPIAGMDANAVEATVLTSPAAVETRLARGGDDVDGADVAVMPLPDLVVMFDRLRALEPAVVAVGGYSHGLEELTAPGDAAPPKAGETVGSSGDAAATTLALFALDWMRTDVSKIKLVTDPNDVANAAWVAGPHGASKKRIVLSSADASRLVPEVIVASRRAREAKKADVAKFITSFLDGVGRVRGNAPGVAKELEAHRPPLFSAASDKTQSALAIVERLGQIEWAGAPENADAFGISDAKTAHLDETLGLTWRLLRTAGVVAASTPATLPIVKDFVAEIAKPAPRDTKPPADLLDDAGAPKGLNVLLARKYDDVDEGGIIGDVGLASRLFDHAFLRVNVRGGAAPSRVLAGKARKDAMSDRIYPGTSALGTSAALVEICAAP
jgi:hypothetical protein